MENKRKKQYLILAFDEINIIIFYIIFVNYIKLINDNNMTLINWIMLTLDFVDNWHNWVCVVNNLE